MEILTQLLFFSTVVFFVLWMSGRKKTNSSDEVDKNSNSYAQGYWDGYKIRKSEEQTGKFENEAYLIEQTGNLDFIADDEVSNAELNDVNEEVYVNDEEIKAKHKLQNINTTLYVASFLLVAAVALFIGTSLPEQVRFMGVCVITALFYISGLYLYDKYEKLKPAATAFVGTGLAILPFVGIAMYNFVLPDASICWLFTSIIGVIAFTYAAIKLKNQIVAYLAIAFMISMSTSSVATLGAGLIWYYVVLIAFGSLVTFIATIYPQSLPSAFSKPIQVSSQWIVPLTLIASFMSFTALSVTDYWIISLISAIYYVSVAVSSTAERDVAILLARLLASLAVILITFDIFETWIAVGIATTVMGVIQVMASSILHRQSQQLDSNTACLWIGFIMQLIAQLFVMVDSSSWGLIVTVQLGVLTINSIGASLYLKKPELSSFGIFSLAVIPIVVGWKLIEPTLENHTIASIYGVMSLISVAIVSIYRSKRIKSLSWWILLAATSLFAAEALIFVASADAGWRTLIWSVVTVIGYYLVYINRQPWFYVGSNILLIGAILPALEFMGVSSGWCWPIMSWISFLLFYAVYCVLYRVGREECGISFWWSSVVIGLVVNIGGLADLGLDQESVTMVSLSAFSLIAVAGVIIAKGLKDEVYGYIDLGAIICTIAMQRLVGVNVTNLNFLVYTHWWAIVVAGLAYFYHRIGRIQSAQYRYVIALAFISFFTGIMALVGNSDDIPYKVIFLIEHVLILIAGLGFSRKMYAIWGAVGVVLAILWMLSGMTYILLAMLAFGLIGFAVYALTKQSK